jgi:AraC-like DNA-binding protein
MVSLRCKSIVKEELKKLDVKYSILPYGAIEFSDEVGQKKLHSFKRNLRKSGLDLLDLNESILIDRIISTILDLIHNFDELPKLTFSEIISKNISDDNDAVLKIFSEVVGMSVIQFIVTQKIEKIKEFLLYDDLTLAEISRLLRYKNEQHLVAQFKKYTGLTPDHFIKLKEERNKIIRQSLNESGGKKTINTNKPVG